MLLVSDHGYVEMCKLNGLDDFLTGIASLLKGPPQDYEDDGERDLD